jgi:hypothetical protein
MAASPCVMPICRQLAMVASGWSEVLKLNA